jgi:hypothetical protein
VQRPIRKTKSLTAKADNSIIQNIVAKATEKLVDNTKDIEKDMKMAKVVTTMDNLLSTMDSYVEIMKENSENQEEAMLMDMMLQHEATLPNPKKVCIQAAKTNFLLDQMARIQERNAAKRRRVDETTIMMTTPQTTVYPTSTTPQSGTTSIDTMSFSDNDSTTIRKM